VISNERCRRPSYHDAGYAGAQHGRARHAAAYNRSSCERPPACGRPLRTALGREGQESWSAPPGLHTVRDTSLPQTDSVVSKVPTDSSSSNALPALVMLSIFCMSASIRLCRAMGKDSAVMGCGRDKSFSATSFGVDRRTACSPARPTSVRSSRDWHERHSDGSLLPIARVWMALCLQWTPAGRVFNVGCGSTYARSQTLFVYGFCYNML
jgi:hypothetical protein